MSEKVYLDENGEPMKGTSFSGVQGGSSSSAPKVYLDDNGEPIDSRGSQGFLAGAKREVIDQAGALKLLAETDDDIGDNLWSGDADRVKATIKGFGQGAWQGAKDLVSNPLEALDPTGAVAVSKSKDDTSTKAGRAAVLAGEMLVPFTKPLKRIKAMQAAAKTGPLVEQAGDTLARRMAANPKISSPFGGPEASRIAYRAPDVNVPSVEPSTTQVAARTARPEAPAAPRTHSDPTPTKSPVAAPESPTDGRGKSIDMSPEAFAEDARFEAARANRFGHTEPDKTANNDAFRAEIAAAEKYSGPERRRAHRMADGTDESVIENFSEKRRHGSKLGTQRARDAAAERGNTEGVVADRRKADVAARETPKIGPTSREQFTPPATTIASKPSLPVVNLKPRVTLKPGVAADARRALGSKKAAAHLNKLGLSDQLSPDDVKRLAPGPSRRPTIADDADMDAQYRNSLADERGAVDPALLRDIGLGTAGAATGAAFANDDSKVAGGVLGAVGGLAAANPMRAARTLQQLRVMGMLSGAALPKSIAGNVGAFTTAAIEKHSMRPIIEALRLPTNAKNAVHGWKNNANPAHIQGVAKFNLPARTMGALDQSTTKALQRAGLSLEEAQRLLLTSPNTMGDAALGRMMKSDVGRVAFPFQNTPMNAVAEGGKSLAGMIGRPVTGMAPHTRTQKALTLASGVAGAGAGAVTDDPKALALLAAFAGPRGIPFAMGAGTTAGKRAMEQIGVGLPDGSWSDFISPESATRPITDPAILRFLEWIQGIER